MENKITPFEATHPGELIKDELKDRGMSQKQLSDLTGIRQTVLSQIVNGRRSLTNDYAAALEKALGIPAYYWMNLQKQFDYDSAEICKLKYSSINV